MNAYQQYFTAGDLIQLATLAQHAFDALFKEIQAAGVPVDRIARVQRTMPNRDRSGNLVIRFKGVIRFTELMESQNVFTCVSPVLKPKGFRRVPGRLLEFQKTAPTTVGRCDMRVSYLNGDLECLFTFDDVKPRRY